MAYCITPQWSSSTTPQVKLTVTATSSTAMTTTLSWVLEYVAHGYAAQTSTARAYTVIFNGETVASGTYVINGKTGTSTITSGTKVINRFTYDQTVAFGCSMAFNLTWSGVYGGTQYSESSIVVLAAADTNYTVSYNANGGSGAPSSQTKVSDVNLTLSSVIPTRSGYTFLGWNTYSTANVARYVAGDTYTANASVTLYAIWSASYSAPIISGLSVYRCNSSGTASDTGTYAKVIFNWRTNSTVSSIYISWGSSSTSVSASGTSGSVNRTVGNGALNADTVYTFQITVTDRDGGTTTITRTIATQAFTIDFLAGGNGVAIGKAATKENLFDVGLPAHFSGGITEDVAVHSSGDCNSLTASGTYYIGTSGTNRPVNTNGWLIVRSYDNGNYCYQQYITYTGERYYRMRDSGTWGSWMSSDAGGTTSAYTDVSLSRNSSYFSSSSSITFRYYSELSLCYFHAKLVASSAFSSGTSYAATSAISTTYRPYYSMNLVGSYSGAYGAYINSTDGIIYVIPNRALNSGQQYQINGWWVP